MDFKEHLSSFSGFLIQLDKDTCVLKFLEQWVSTFSVFKNKVWNQLWQNEIKSGIEFGGGREWQCFQNWHVNH